MKNIKLSDYEEQRLRNVADNQAMLSKLMKDLKKMTPKLPKASASKKISRKSDGDENYKSKVSDLRRYQLPARVTRSRSRRGSLSSDSSSSGDSSPSKDDHLTVSFGGKRFFDEEDEEDHPRKRARRSLPVGEREIKSAEEVTEEDLENVATTVSVKVYNQTNGTSCHQCRQKTLDQKTICRSEACVGVRGQFCGVCLRNRYGEDIKVALKDPHWECPPCRDCCNCSICRNRQGKAATGILIHLAREHGFENVLDFLSSFKTKKGNEKEAVREKETNSDTEQEKETNSDTEQGKETKPVVEEKENICVVKEKENISVVEEKENISGVKEKENISVVKEKEHISVVEENMSEVVEEDETDTGTVEEDETDTGTVEEEG